MPDSLAQLRKENDDLRLLALRLSRIALRIVVEQASLPTLHDSRVPLELPAEISPVEIVTALRELAIRTAALRRNCLDGRTAQKLDTLGVEFAVAAEDLETAFGIPPADQAPLRRRGSN